MQAPPISGQGESRATTPHSNTDRGRPHLPRAHWHIAPPPWKVASGPDHGCWSTDSGWFATQFFQSLELKSVSERFSPNFLVGHCSFSAIQAQLFKGPIYCGCETASLRPDPLSSCTEIFIFCCWTALLRRVFIETACFDTVGNYLQGTIG